MYEIRNERKNFVAIAIYAKTQLLPLFRNITMSASQLYTTSQKVVCPDLQCCYHLALESRQTTDFSRHVINLLYLNE